MRPAYYERVGVNLVSLDLVFDPDEPDDLVYITRIVVPKALRGQGYGSMVLERACRDADNEGVTLHLQVEASGGMTDDELILWYRRYGFEIWKNQKKYMVRPPKDQEWTPQRRRDLESAK
jgi:ribosomal protein S18 acetylase RimI-like enzyme